MSAIDLLERISAPWIDRHRLRVRWFDAWHPALDEALQELPEMETCPHELFRMLMQHPSKEAKRTALVSKAGQPVAIAGLRRNKWHWSPVGHDVCPRSIMPVREGYLFPALAALGVAVRIAYWEQPAPPLAWIREPSSIPVYKMDLTTDFERYWRSSGHIKAIRPARSRTKTFTFDVDAPGSVTWSVQQWADKWRDHRSDEILCVDDRILAAEYHQARGQHHTFRLLDNGTPIAASTFFVHRNDLLWQTTFRAPEYTWHRVGTRLLELTFEWAAKAGYSKIDLGGGHEFKSSWAPEDGLEWSFDVCPAHLHLAKTAARNTLKLAMKARALARTATRRDVAVESGTVLDNSRRAPVHGGAFDASGESV